MIQLQNKPSSSGRQLDGRLSIVMPAYNESASIASNLAEIVRTMNALHYDYEIVLVDDGSPDNTYLSGLKAKSRHPERIRIVRYDQNAGKGNALMIGTRYATGPYVAFVDADMDLHPAQLADFIDILLDTNCDVVIGSKLHPQSQVIYPFIRRMYSSAYYGVVRMLFGLPVRDTQTGLKLFRRTVLQRVFPRILVKRFAFDIELLANAHRLGFRIVEAPIHLEFKRLTNRINMKDVRDVLQDTLAIFYRMHVVHYYDQLNHVDIADLPQPTGTREVVAAGRE